MVFELSASVQGGSGSQAKAHLEMQIQGKAVAVKRKKIVISGTLDISPQKRD